MTAARQHVAMARTPVGSAHWQRERSDPTPCACAGPRSRSWTPLANRVGYLLFGLAIALFVFAFAVSFNGGDGRR